MMGLGPLISFGDFQVDAERRRLLNVATGRVVRIGGRPLAALLQLASRPGVLVTKQELTDAVWPDVTVDETSLRQCVASVRRALGEDGSQPKYISTEPGRGYRFIGAAGSGGAKRSSRSSENPMAFQLYVAGWSALTRPRPGNLERGIGQLEEAVSLDPGFALAHVCLADGYALLAVFGVLPPREVFPKALAACLKAIEIDGELAEAHAELGHIRTVYDLDFVRALAHYDRALALNPASPLTLHYIGLQQIAYGRLDEATDYLRRALAEEPLAINVHANLGMILYYAGRYCEAIVLLRETLDMEPDFAHARSYLGRSLAQLGNFDAALAEFDRRVCPTLASEADVPATLAMSGDRTGARARLSTLMEKPPPRHWVSPFELATVHSALSDGEEALRHLEQAVAQSAQPINFLKVDPAFQWLKDKPRFQALLANLGVS
jgi:tetratricopeptide (TPR) repeat protein